MREFFIHILLQYVFGIFYWRGVYVLFVAEIRHVYSESITRGIVSTKD